jgi:hypothetical protein
MMDMFIYSCSGNCLITFRKLTTTVTDEGRPGVINAVFAKYRANTLYVFAIEDITSGASLPYYSEHDLYGYGFDYIVGDIVQSTKETRGIAFYWSRDVAIQQGAIPHKGTGYCTKYNDNGNLKAYIWYSHGKIHRDDDLPAIVFANGLHQWYKNGKLHRDGDKPAHIHHRGHIAYYKQGKLHREADFPAFLHPDGSCEFVYHGQLWKEQGSDGRVTQLYHTTNS